MVRRRHGAVAYSAGQLGAGVSDRVEHVPNLDDRVIRSAAGRRILTGGGEGPNAGSERMTASGAKRAVEVDVGSHELPLCAGPTSTASANPTACRNDRRSQNSELPTTNQLLSNLRSATIFCFCPVSARDRDCRHSRPNVQGRFVK
jgi:hypothetical protein